MNPPTKRKRGALPGNRNALKGRPVLYLMCECGKPAAHLVIVPGLTSDLHNDRPTALYLCNDCYRLELSMCERILYYMPIPPGTRLRRHHLPGVPPISS